MYWFPILGILLGTPSGFSQTYLELSANMEGAVCPGVDVIYNCTTDAPAVKWTAQPYFTQFPLIRVSDVASGNSGAISIARISRDPFTSTLTITSSEGFDSTEVICDGRNSFVKTITYRRIQDTSTAPVVSAVNSADVIHEANTLRLRLTLQFTISNGRGASTLEVSPSAVSLGSLQNITSSTYSVVITLLYNTNYTLMITASNCVGQARHLINFLTVNCFTPNVAADVRVWPFTSTLEGATITYSCSDGYLPQTKHTSQCTQVGGSGYWIPYPAPRCSIVCSVPPSLMAVPEQANDGLPYVEGNVVNFQCLSGLSPADVMTATCTMEGSWRPDPQRLNCATEDTTTTTATKSTQVGVPVVVAGMCFFLLGMLCGVAAGMGVVCIYIKCNRKTHPPPSQPSPPAPLYEDIELPTTTKHEVELQHNVAYGHAN